MATNVIFNNKNVIFNGKNVVVGEITPAETNLWIDGPTATSGTWNTVKNTYNFGQTIAFGTSITSTTESNSNSSHGTLIYPSNKVTVTQGETISLDIASTNQNSLVIYCPDTNVVKWTFYISVVYMDSVPSDFHSTFDINAWVESKAHNTLADVWGSGSDSSKNMAVRTYSGTVPVTGSYYVCLIVHGYDSRTHQLEMNNFKIV